MLPPVNQTVLRLTPTFDQLYKDLCTRKLNPDGSTRDVKKQRVHEGIRQDLAVTRTNVHATALLIETLSFLPALAPTLKPELHALIEIVIAQLNSQVSDTDRETLKPDVEDFLTHIDTIAEALSTQFTTAANLLHQMVDPVSDQEFVDLETGAEHLRTTALVKLPAQLASEKYKLATATFDVLNLHRQATETSIQILEQTQHGSLARFTKARAEHAQAQATALGLQAQLHTHTSPVPVEFLTALKNFKASQRASERNLKDREAVALSTLDLYERAGGKAIRDVAKRKEHLLQQMNQVEGEIKRIQGT